MKLDPQIQPRRAAARGLQRRRAVGIAAAGAVIFSGLAMPPATAAPLTPDALAGILPMAVPEGPTGPTSVGPVDPDNGYPYWYGDAGLPAVDGAPALDPIRLDLCFDMTVCPPEAVAEAGYDLEAPLSIPENFPEEAFWWSAETELLLSDGSDARVIMAQEAAFGGSGAVAAGQQNAFARLRIRIDEAVPGATYRITHPYGVDVLTADPERDRLRFTEDIGCLQQPCTWEEPTDGRVGGPFLRWDADAPAGTIGDPAIQHTVVGSPYGTNLVNIEILQDDGTYVSLGDTDLFNVMGKIATLQVDVDKPGGLFQNAVDVNIQSSFPAESKIVYTLDGSEPAVNTDGSLAHGTEFTTADPKGAALVQLTKPGITTLKYMAVDMTTLKTTPVSTEVYELDASTPWIDASPDGSELSYAGPQSVTLTGTSTSGTHNVLYTTDGSEPQYTAEGEPTGTTKVYTSPVTVGVSGAIKAVTVETQPAAVEGDPTTLNPGEVRTFDYTIHNLQSVGSNGVHGFPETLTDNGFGDQAPVTLDLCMDDPFCPTMDVKPFPNEPISWPGNFPGESFWWVADADMTYLGEEVSLGLAFEAAFSVDQVREGDQVAFGRIRVRGDDVFEIGATYKAIHPYGTVLLTADDTGSLNYTEDLGALNGTGDFSALMEAKIGPFLRSTGPNVPEGYLGDGTTPTAVTGSPYSTNFFQLEKVANAAGEPDVEVLATTDQFVVQGRIAGTTPTPPDTVTPVAQTEQAGGVFANAQAVTLTAEPGTADIFFTTNGSEPSATNGTLFTEPIQIADEGTTTLKFVAINGDLTSEVVTQTYTVDTTAPAAVIASPAGGAVAETADVTLNAEEGATVYYTLDGADPTAESNLYAGTFQVSEGQTLKAVAIDAAGNISDLGTWEFTAVTEEPGAEEPGTVSGSGDFNSDGNADIVAADASGKLWLYPGNGQDDLESRVQIGVGWNAMSELFSPGDFNADGDTDVIARDRSGRLWLYAGNGQDGLEPRVQIGVGWNTMSGLFSPGDFNADGDTDVIARDRSGRLWLYAGNGQDGLEPRVQIGVGWNAMNGLM